MGVSLQVRTKILSHYAENGHWTGNSTTVTSVTPARGHATVLCVVEAVIDDGSYNLTPQSGTITFNQWGTMFDDFNHTSKPVSYAFGPYNFESAFNETKLSGGTVTVELFRMVEEFGIIGGAYNFSASFGSITAKVTYSTGTSSGNLTLNHDINIPGGASSSPELGSAVEAAHGILGVSQAIGVTKPIDRYVKVKYTCTGNNFETTGWIFGDSNNYTTIVGPDGPELMYKDVYTSTEWTPPLELARHFPTTDKVNVVFTTYTYDSDHNVKSIDYDTRTYILLDKYGPSCELTVTDSLGYYNKYGAFVAGRSKYAVDIDAEGIYGSYISRYYATANGQVFNESDFITNALTTPGESLVRATVTDSRGRNVTIKAEFHVLEYSVPKITSLTAVRCDVNGNTSEAGSYIKVVFSATASPLYDLNKTIYAVKYKKTIESDSEYTIVELPEYEYLYEVTDATYIFPADTATTYSVVLMVTDDFGTRTRSVSGSSTSKLLSFLSKGAGVAIGKVAELIDHLDIGWPTRFRKSVHLDNAQKIYGTSNDDEDVCMLHLDSNDNTAITGNKITLTADNGVYINGRLHLIPTNESATSVLWSGTSYMRYNQNAYLSEPISEQVHGVALVWSYYVYPDLYDTDFQVVYIPKELVALKGPVDMTFLLGANFGKVMATKRLLISDSSIIGCEGNDGVATETDSGVTSTPQRFVLRYVIGV